MKAIALKDLPIDSFVYKTLRRMISCGFDLNFRKAFCGALFYGAVVCDEVRVEQSPQESRHRLACKQEITRKYVHLQTRSFEKKLTVGSI